MTYRAYALLFTIFFLVDLKLDSIHVTVNGSYIKSMTYSKDRGGLKTER